MSSLCIIPGDYFLYCIYSIQTDNGSAFISLEFKIVLRENKLTHSRIHPHTPTENALVERANRTVREETDSHLMLNYQDAVNEIEEIVSLV